MRLVDGLDGGLQIRPRGLGDGVELFERQHAILELKRAGDIELVYGRLVIEQHAQGDPGGAGVDQRVLVIALVLGALHLHAVEIHAGDIAGLEAAAEDGELLIEIIQVLLGLDQELLGLQGLDEGAAQSEEHGAFQVELLRLGNGGGFLRAFEAQFPLVPRARADNRRRRRAAGIQRDGRGCR